MADPGIVEAFRLQAYWCRRLGSPLYEQLLASAADDIASGGPMGRLVSGWDGGDPIAQALALRVMGAVHRVVLEGDAPGLAAHYPSAGGSPVFPSATTEFLVTVERHMGRIRPALDQQVQTNEVGRSAVLLAPILVATRHHHLPIKLHEIGSSAGLNLNLDRYHYDLGDAGSFGPPASPVHLTSDWIGEAPALTDRLVIEQRTGSDPYPIDVMDLHQTNRLLSFIWPDQRERHMVTNAAVDLFRKTTPTLLATSAPSHLASIETAPGYLTVVMQSVMRQYMSDADVTASHAKIDRLGAMATPTAPFAHVEMEPARERMEVAVTLWPGNERTVLGRAHAHGIRVRFGA